MKKLLFLIHDLGQGGAEKVLVNLVNNMDHEKFDITVMSLFDVGVNKQFLSPKVRYLSCFKHMPRGNSQIMKLFTPQQLHKKLIREHYDVEIAYLEGPCARIISGCPNADTRLVSWIHIEQHTAHRAAASFRSVDEATACYNKFHQIVCVSRTVMEDFQRCLPVSAPICVRYNTNESEKVLRLSSGPVEADLFPQDEIKLVGVGKLLKRKGFDRMIRMIARLRQAGHAVCLYLLGNGSEEDELRKLTASLGIEDAVTFLGYQTNPYKYVSKCDLFLCASFAEGFSTAATEALIVGTPVCTVEVSGMKEMLGQHNEWGVVTDNDEDALYQGVKMLLDDPALLFHYKKQAEIRGKTFSTENTVKAVEDMLENL